MGILLPSVLAGLQLRGLPQSRHPVLKRESCGPSRVAGSMSSADHTGSGRSDTCASVTGTVIICI